MALIKTSNTPPFIKKSIKKPSLDSEGWIAQFRDRTEWVKEKQPLRYTLSNVLGNLTDDPIALACWMHEHGKKDTSVFYSDLAINNLIDSIGGAKVTTSTPLKPRHNKTAQKIRDYYSQKFLMISLRSQHKLANVPPGYPPRPLLSKFRIELMQYLVESKDNKEYTEDQIGMIYSLPRLYKEDQLLDKLREKYNVSAWKDKEPNALSVRKTLFYIDVHRKTNWHAATRRVSPDSGWVKRTPVYRKNKEFFNYWFHDENDRLYCIDLEMDHPFQRMWSRLIEFPLEVEGKIYKNHSRDGLNYYTFSNWEILEEF